MALAAVVAAVSAGGGLFFFRNDPPEPAPFSSRLPVDTVFYLGIPDLPALTERARGLTLKDSESWRRFADTVGLSPILSACVAHETKIRSMGPQAALAARKTPSGLHWVVLFRAGRSDRLFGGSGREGDWHYVVDGDRVILSKSPEVVEEFRRAPSAPLEIPIAGDGPVLHVLPAAFPGDAWALWCVRWEDFSCITARVELGSDLHLRGLARYAPASYQTALEQYVKAPPRAVAPAGAVAWTTQLEHAPRFWRDVLSSLNEEDRRLVEHELRLLERDYRDPVRELLPRLGPAWGAAVTPRGELTGAIELANAPEVPEVLRRSIRDYVKAMRDRGRELLIDLVGGEPQFRTWRPVLHLGDKRLELGDPPILWGPGRHHLGTTLDIPALQKILRTPDGRVLADLFFKTPDQAAFWAARLEWADRAEAWTRYAPAGAEVEAQLTFAP